MRSFSCPKNWGTSNAVRTCVAADHFHLCQCDKRCGNRRSQHHQFPGHFNILSNRFPCGAMGSSRPTVPPHFTTSQWPVSGTTLIFGLLSTSLKRLSLSPSADISAWGNAANWAASFRPIPFPVPDTMRSCADAHGSKTGFSSESGEYPSQTSVCAPTLPHYQGGPLQSPARQESNLHRHGLPHD